YKILDVGDIGVFEIKGGFASQLDILLEGAGARGLDVAIGASTFIKAYEKTIDIGVSSGSSDYKTTITCFILNLNPSYGYYTGQINAPTSLVNKGYVDLTQIGTAIPASKTFALTDAGAKKITAVNSASAVVLTIPTNTA